MSENNNRQTTHTHHQHHHHHAESSARFKNKALNARRRRKIVGKITFVSLCLVAIAIVLFVGWIYTH